MIAAVGLRLDPGPNLEKLLPGWSAGPQPRVQAQRPPLFPEDAKEREAELRIKPPLLPARPQLRGCISARMR